MIDTGENPRSPADAHNGNVTVAWTPPTDNGGSAITGYLTKLWPAGANPNTTAPNNTWFCAGACTAATWTNFPDNTSWFWGVSTRNAVGDSTTAYSANFTVQRLPGQPGAGTAYPGNAQLLTTWTAAPTNGGPTIDRYDVYRYDTVTAVWTLAGSACGTCASFQVTGLTNGRSYTVGVYAHNQWGLGPYGTAVAVTPAANAVPFPPQLVNASAGNASAWVVWDDPKPNGATAVTGYYVQLYKAGVVQATSGFLPKSTSGMNTFKWNQTGLTNGTAYTFRVYPYNGTSLGATADTNAITPYASPPPFPAVTASLTATDHGLLATWSAPDASSPLPTSYFVQILAEDGSYYTAQATAVPAAVFGNLTNGVRYRVFISPSGINGAAAGYAFTPYVAPSSSLANLAVPTNVQATRGDTQATVTWTAPTISVSGVTTYIVRAYAGPTLVATSASTTNTSTVVTGLRNGTAVTFTVTATTVLLTGNPSAPSNTVTPAGKPFAPENAAATRGDHQLALTWSPPSARADGTPGNNGDAITGYTVTLYNDTTGAVIQTLNAATTSITATGLTNGQAYYFTVHATNTLGSGPESTQSNTATPAGPPTTPTNVVAVAGNSTASATWSAAAPNGSTVTSYIVTASPGGQSATVSGTSTSATVNSLTNGVTYTLGVVAINDVGPSQAGVSNPVTPVGPPSIPTNVAATAGDSSADVTWQPSNPNGATVTYTVTASPGSATAQSSETGVSVGQLQNGITYTFTVVATNAAGASSPSAPSNPVTPVAACIENAPAVGHLSVSALSECNPSLIFQCNNGKDDDGDGHVDYPDDPGCSSYDDNSENSEFPPALCSDGLDNDGDGLTDYPADPGCTSSSDNDETDAPVTTAPNAAPSIYIDNRGTDFQARGCAQGQASTAALVVLDYGAQSGSASGYAGAGFGATPVLSRQENVQIAEAYVTGFFSCASATAHLKLGLGTNNGGAAASDPTNAGAGWAAIAGEVRDWAVANYPRLAIYGGVDIESGFASLPSTRAWVDGYNAAADAPEYYEFGDAAGCPQSGASAGQNPVCNNGYSLADYAYFAGFGGRGVGLPEIYNTTGANARQWQQISKLSVLNNGTAVFFDGSLTQYGACAKPRPCGGVDNTAAAGWQQLYDALASDPSTMQSRGLPFASDIYWATDHG
ncbi:MAG: fibronectin type III domain-containing protein [Acidimicrobiales bacterium]